MTLPDERTRAVNRAREFLRSLLNPKETPRVPRAVRDAASCVLRHFPSGYDMKLASKKIPNLFGDEDE